MSQRKTAEIPAAMMNVNILLTLVKRPPLNRPQRFSMSSCSQLNDTMAGRGLAAAGVCRPVAGRLVKSRPAPGTGLGGGGVGAVSIKSKSFLAHLNHIDPVAVVTHHDRFHHRPQPCGNDSEAHQVSGPAQEELEESRQPLSCIEIMRTRIAGQHR